MKCRISVRNQIKFFLLFTVFWIYRSNGKDLDSTKDVLGALLGTAGGYTYYVIIATVVLIGALFIINDSVSINSVNCLLRRGRSYCLKENLVSASRSLLVYVAGYVCIPVIYYCISDFKGLISDYKFLPIMFLFMFGIYEVFLIYMLLYFYIGSFCKRSYTAIVMVAVISFLMIMVIQKRIIGQEILYGAISIIEVLTGVDVNIYRWFMFRAMDLCILSVIYILVSDRYKRMDVL